MSQILNHLKRAEAERERVITERKRVESEADAGLAAREREEAVSRAPQGAHSGPAPRAQKRGLGPGLGLGLVVIAGITVALPFAGDLFRKASAPTASPAPSAPPAPAVVAAPAAPAGRIELRLDRDAEGFAARVRETERR